MMAVKEGASLLQRYQDKLVVNPELSRATVSFQANKKVPFYRWFKYKEAFSSEFVKYVLEKFCTLGDKPRRVLDPFAGVGTTLTTAAKAGCKATGIELLPVGPAAVRARLIADKVNIKAFESHLRHLENLKLNQASTNGYHFPHLRITERAFSQKTERALSAYMQFLDNIGNTKIRYLFWFACLSILEDVSYTRKDGQYLRWDHRSGRTLKSNFNKGVIQDFQKSIVQKLQLLYEDIKRQGKSNLHDNVEIIAGSCLDELPKIRKASFDLVITSPPYCNRYDYTRTYALELAFMNYNDAGVKDLRQILLSATVENKAKIEQIRSNYASRNKESRYNDIVHAFENQLALQEVLASLRHARSRNQLNNNNIPDMVENYFFEMNFVINELSHVLAPNGHVVMVNDNVRYNGTEIPVDLILSDFATSAGLSVDAIWVLQRGKGNSSQQMGNHGRRELRKCVYVWSKPK